MMSEEGFTSPMINSTVSNYYDHCLLLRRLIHCLPVYRLLTRMSVGIVSCV